MEAPKEKPAVVADIPDIKDKLDFAPYAKTVTDIIQDPNVKTPLTIGIFGSWGSGKTSLMQMIREQLKDAALASLDQKQPIIWFNAWLYSKEQALWRALIVQVLAVIRKEYGAQETGSTQDGRELTVADEVDALAEQLHRTAGPGQVGSISFSAASLLGQDETGDGAQISLSVPPGLDVLGKVTKAPKEAEERMRAFSSQVEREAAALEQERIESLEQFQDKFKSLVKTYIEDEGSHLVVFVDDLDRCLPEKAVEVLEAIKLFLDVPGCIFILGIDQDVVERGILLRYREMAGLNKDAVPDQVAIIDGRRYLEKIIQIPFALPPISPEAMGRFIAQIAPKVPADCGNVFAQGLERNPRQVKRAINIYTLLITLSRNKPQLTPHIKPVRLAKLVVIQQRFPDFYEMLPTDPGLLIEVEKYCREGNNLVLVGTGEDVPDWFRKLHFLSETDRIVLSALLTMHPATGDGFEEFNFANLAPGDVLTYVYLTRTVTEQPAPSPPTPPPSTVQPTPDIEEGKTIAPEDLPKDFVYLELGLSESRRGYIEQRAFGELEGRRYTDIDKERGKYILEELARAGGQFYQQIFSDPDRRKMLAGQLKEPTTVRVPAVIEEIQIPWEIVYEQTESMDMVQQKMSKASLEPVTWERFLGGKHIIERPVTGHEGETGLLELGASPTVNLVLEMNSSRAEDLLVTFNSWVAEGQILKLERPKKSSDFALSLVSDPSSIYVFHSQAGFESGETWISFGTEEAAEINRVELYQVVRDKFNLEELRTLAFDLNVDYDWLGGDTKSAQARELVSYLDRRGMLPELVELITAQRPDITLSRSGERLTRQQLMGWEMAQRGNALLYLDVNAGIGRANDWGAWLDLFFNLGFGGVIAPMITPDLSWSADMLIGFLDIYLKGEKGAGAALLEARTRLFEDFGNPLGLLYAHFGPAGQKLVLPGVEATSEGEVV